MQTPPPTTQIDAAVGPPPHSWTLADIAPEQAPVYVAEVHLDEPLAPMGGCGARSTSRVWMLVRLHTHPLGHVGIDVPRFGLSSEHVAQAIWACLGNRIASHLESDDVSPAGGIPADGLKARSRPHCLSGRTAVMASAPSVSIVIATKDRTESLDRCLSSLQTLNYPDFEVLVVDSAPQSDETALLVQQRRGVLPSLRYLRVGRPGLAVAHNAAMPEARGDLLAFTDDDVVVDRHWLAALAEGFSVAPDVGCVTGLIAPAELETPAQLWVEQYGGFCKGFERSVFGLQVSFSKDRLFPYSAGRFGSGANMAFRSTTLRAMGGFDPALGAGTKARGGDDLAGFLQVLRLGERLVYEPGAIVRHWHRREYDALRRTAHGYGVGLGAYLSSAVAREPHLLLDFAKKLPEGLAHLRGEDSPKNSNKAVDFPAELETLERVGLVRGPFAYAHSRWRDRRTRVRRGETVMHG